MKNNENFKKLNLNLTYLFVILTFVLLLSIINTTWLYNPYGWVDQWAYFGQSYFYPRLIQLFPLHPSGDLLPVILPSALFYKILPPLSANLCRDIIFLSIFLYTLFLHIRRLTNTTTGLVVTFFAGGYQYLLSAVGSDYTDGFVIIYYALALYSISRSRVAQETIEKPLLIVSGSMFGCMVYSAILSITYLPTLFLLYVLNFPDRNISIWTTLINRSLKFTISYLIGFSATTLFFSFFYWAHADGFFFANNIQKLFMFVGGGYTAPPFSLWLADASWLIIPAGVVIASSIYLLLYFLRCRTATIVLYSLEEKHVVTLIVLLSFSTMMFINLVVKQWSLQFLYFDQTLPITFLGLGVLLGHLKETTSFQMRMLEIGSAALAALFTLWILDHYVVTWHTVQNLVKLKSEVVLFIGVLVTSIFLSLAMCNRTMRSCAVTWLVVLNVFSFSPTFGNFLCWDAFARINMPKSLSSNESIFLATIKLANFVDRIDSDRIASIWYNENEAFGPLIRQVNAVVYLNSGNKRINKTFPKLNDFGGPIGSEGHIPYSGETLLILSLDVDHLHHAVNSLKERGLTIKRASTSELQLDTTTVIYASKVFLN